jgi:hypothetical protein
MLGGLGNGELNVVHVVIIILLLLILWKLHNTGERLKEKQYVGQGLDRSLYTSGATMRRLGQVFSQPAQGVQTTIYNAELRQTPQTSAQGIPVIMYLDSGNANIARNAGNVTNLYNALNDIPEPGAPNARNARNSGNSGNATS